MTSNRAPATQGNFRGSGLALTDMAGGIGRVLHAKTYNRIAAGGRTLVYVN